MSKESGLYYLQSRYYDPEIGRFINADAYASTGQGILGNNMFAYCGNNPACCFDPSGCCSSCTMEIGRSQFSMSTGGCSIEGSLAIGALATGAAIAVGTVLSKAISDIYEYSRSLQDTSADPYDDHQPRVHHVIPRGDFLRYGSETANKVFDMHEILAGVGISINDPENLVIISHGTHKSMHTKHYIDSIYEIMMWADPESETSVRIALFLARTYAASLDQYPMGY